MHGQTTLKFQNASEKEWEKPQRAGLNTYCQRAFHPDIPQSFKDIVNSQCHPRFSRYLYAWIAESIIGGNLSYKRVRGRAKATHVQVWTCPEGSRSLRLPYFMTDRHMKVSRLSALRTRHLYPYPFLLETISAISVAGRIMSMKISKDAVGIRTRDLPVCIAVPQPNAPPTWELSTFPAVMSVSNCLPVTIIVRPS